MKYTVVSVGGDLVGAVTAGPDDRWMPTVIGDDYEENGPMCSFREAVSYITDRFVVVLDGPPEPQEEPLNAGTSET